MTGSRPTKQRDIQIEKWVEFQRGWPALLAACMGLGFGITGLFAFNIGLFANDLERLLNMSRGEYGLGLLVLTVFLFMAAPVAGRLIDRYGPKFPAVCGIILLAIGFVGLATSVRYLLVYYLAMGFFGIAGSLSSPIGYTRTVTSWFEKSRGLALGIAMASIGISSIFVPLAVGRTIQADGWRAGFLLLAAFAACAIPTTLALLRLNPHEAPHEAPHETPIPAASATIALADNGQQKFALIGKDRKFWLLIFCFSTMSFGFVGFTIHLIPLLRDSGLNLVQAAHYGALLGISVILSRIFIGALADIVHVPFLAAGICLLGCCAAVTLLSHLPDRLPIAVLCLGVVVGAENDLLSYLTARYFGLGVYSRAYGWQFACFTLSAGLGSAVIGAIYDRAGSYHPALIMMAILALAAGGLFLTLPRYAPMASNPPNNNDFR